MRQRLLIIGAGMAAAYLLQELGRAGADMDITVVGEERDTCYNRVLLSNILAGDSVEADLHMIETGTGTGTIQFLSATRVAAVDIERCRVVTDRQLVLSYDLLVFATGATVARPALAGDGIRGVEQFRTLDDARHLRSLAGASRPAVVVGGGLLGLEAAHGLNTLGFATTVVHRQSWLMNRQLDAEGGRQLQQDLQGSGIRFRLGDTLAAVNAAAGVLTGVELRSGDALPCELLVFATGITPNALLAREAGLAVDRGILIDGHMRASVPGVFALGECSQLGAECFGLVAPIREQARVLARSLMGVGGDLFRAERSPTQLKISGIDIFSAGDLDAAAEQLVMRDEAAGIYRRLVLRHGRLVGVVLVGDKRGGTWYSELIRSGSDISGFRSGLIFGREVSEALQQTARAA
ncbi:MAG: NAD(P)/FAD-dependent oxidoreductase [Pseudomonadales bacterium]|nr:NAD(P)/FAD-dependent oxidoreductase [Halioglobus sp.]MCP5120924.1 NAD(P)/FAD-dependent oxidoreductase [Pseudomonadales bacterium]MCP5194366.1 NAD(P)/FAD-dependent oxidoreductase [Pseudomonadales bacterium]